MTHGLGDLPRVDAESADSSFKDNTKHSNISNSQSTAVGKKAVPSNPVLRCILNHSPNIA